MSVENEAVKRGLMLALLYANKDRSWTTVRAESFSPPLTKHEIMVIGRDFHRANIIEGHPGDDGDRVFMRITLHGEAVWTGRESAALKLFIPSDAPTHFLVALVEMQARSGHVDEDVLQAVKKRYVAPDCPADEKASIVELNRSVLMPLLGYTQLPPGVIHLPGAKPSSPPQDKRVIVGGRVPGSSGPVVQAQKGVGRPAEGPGIDALDKTTESQAKDEKAPSTFEEGLVRGVWGLRFRWLIIGVVVLGIVAYAVYAAQPDEIKIKILKFLRFL